MLLSRESLVFNTPGANANGVKELVIAGMLLAARDIIGGINWVQEYERQNEDIAENRRKEEESCLQERSSKEKNWV